MAIGMVNGVPRVEAHDGRVAIWVQPVEADEEAIGLVLETAAATDTAIKMLGVVGDIGGDRVAGFDVEAMSFDVAFLPAACTGKLTLVIDGVPVHALLDETQIAEMAAAFVAASKAIDAQGGGPQANR